MERISLSNSSVEEAAERAAVVLRAGGVILYPTDTLYGLGADALSDEAVGKIYDIKERDEAKPVHAIVADLEVAQVYVDVDSRARALAARFLPGPLTLVLKKESGVDTGIARGRGTLAIRIPDHPFCLALAKAFGRPYTTTSANVSGAPSGRRVEDILAQLGERAKDIDLIVDAGELPERKPSTVVDLSGPELKILREGAIPAADILAAATI